VQCVIPSEPRVVQCVIPSEPRVVQCVIPSEPKASRGIACLHPHSRRHTWQATSLGIPPLGTRSLDSAALRAAPLGMTPVFGMQNAEC
ncbi:MAG TPA: hypothetical protein VIL97_02115, partial [Thermoanaerobaculia bacterium]